jgi:hypothetical protein
MGRTFLLVVCCLAASVIASAETAKTVYYAGEAITTAGPKVDRHAYLLARTIDPDANTITEKVVSFQRSSYVENSSVIKINQNQFTLTETTGSVTGGGTLTGTPWNWTFLRGEFKVQRFNMRIVDFNFFAEPNFIAGHKDFYITNGGAESLMMQEDVSLHLVTQSVYEARRKELLGS